VVTELGLEKHALHYDSASFYCDQTTDDGELDHIRIAKGFFIKS